MYIGDAVDEVRDSVPSHAQQIEGFSQAPIRSHCLNRLRGYKDCGLGFAPLAHLVTSIHCAELRKCRSPCAQRLAAAWASACARVGNHRGAVQKPSASYDATWNPFGYWVSVMWTPFVGMSALDMAPSTKR